MEEAKAVIHDVEESFKSLPTRFRPIGEKLKEVLGGNTDFAELCRLRETADSRVRENDAGWSVETLMCLRYAPVVSCDVERSFSQYKAILRENRSSLHFENLREYVVVACNTF